MAKAALTLITSTSADHPFSAPHPGVSEVTAARQAKLAEAFSDLEGPLRDLGNMASIAYGLLKDAIGAPRATHLAITGKPECFFITESRVEELIFATSHVLSMVREITEDWYQTTDAAGA